MKKLISAILLIFSCSFVLFGQIEPIDNQMPTAYQTSIPAYGNNLYRFFIDGGTTTSSPATWSWATTAASPFTLPSSSVLSLDPNTGRVTGDFSSIAGARTYIIRVTATFTGGTSTINKEYTLVKSALSTPPTCPTREYALVLDLSGSMNWPSSKWDILQGATKRFLLTITPLLTSSDQLSVIFFNGTSASTRTPAGTTFGAGWLSTDTSIQSTLFDDPPPRTPTGATPLGAGLRQAIDGFFSSSGTLRTIILFTDGMQNESPMVTGAGMNIIEAAGGNPMIDLNSAAYNDMKIMTIGVGAGTSFADQLRLLSNPDGEYAQVDIITSPELDVFFDRTIPVSLAGCSPRILDYKGGTLAGDGTPITESFYVNRFTDQLIIRLTAHKGSLYEAELVKDGTVLPFPGIIENNSVIFNIDFPFYFPDSLLRNDKGEWQIRFTGSEGGQYEVIAMVDDHFISTDLSLGNGNKFYVGDAIPVSLNVQYADAPLDGVTAEAILLRPGDDLGDLAAETFVDSSNLIITETETALGQAKLEYLLTDSNFVEKLRREGLLKTLSPTDNGSYTTSFVGDEPGSIKYNNNELTGTYRVYVRASGNSGLGPFTDWTTKCAFVDFSRPEDIILQEQLIDLGVNSENEHRFKLVFNPINKFGRKIGPAQLDRIQVSLSQGQASVGPLNDNLDGTYSTVIKVLEGDEAKLSISVIDFQSPVDEITIGVEEEDFKKFGISIHAGATWPLGELDTLYNSFGMAEVDLTYRFNRHIAAELIGGYYGFDADHYILGGSLFGLYSLNSSNPLDLHIGLGIGAFQPKNEAITYGTGLKTGLSIALNSSLKIGLEASYYTLPDKEYEFGTGSVFMKYFF